MHAELLFLFIFRMPTFWQYYACPVCQKKAKNTRVFLFLWFCIPEFGFDPEIARLGAFFESIEKPIHSSGDRHFKIDWKGKYIAKTILNTFKAPLKKMFSRPSFPSKKELLWKHLNIFNIQIATPLWNNQQISFINECNFPLQINSRDKDNILNLAQLSKSSLEVY